MGIPHESQTQRRLVLLPGREGHVGVTAKDNRLFVEAVLFRYRAGIPWRDLPAGGRRLIQRADGYRHTFVAGVETMRAGELTGERPGRLVRGAQTAG